MFHVVALVLGIGTKPRRNGSRSGRPGRRTRERVLHVVLLVAVTCTGTTSCSVRK